MPRGEAGRFDSILSAGDVEHLVCATGLRAPAFRLVRDGTPLPPGAYTSDIPWGGSCFAGMADPVRVAQEHAGGATIVLQGLHLHWTAAALFCRDLERRLGFPVQANAYATPAAARGFALHHDTHDVFVLQVDGTKRWRIHRPLVELPLTGQRWSPGLGDPGEAFLDVTLAPGDTLYLPRGWPHEAVTDRAESLHLTMGLHPPTRLDALRAALDACAEDVEFRRALPADGALPAGLLERLGARLAPEAVAARARHRFVAGRRAIGGDQLTQARAARLLGPQDMVARRETVIADLSIGDHAAVLCFEGKEVRFPLRAASAVAGVFAAADPFSAAGLPGPLDEPGRLVLVRRLVREGFLRLADAAPGRT